ncbi:MAG TPA: MGMT family protein [Candidatus Saccharimonadaceae bacterium]|nr:MGMT family protein [Candidatus Saccharimonadaceae bacterium]
MAAESDFRARVYQLMAELPVDKVTTYGDIAGMAGHAYAARIVGGIAHYGPPELPWHRLVNRFGGLASGFPGGREAQAQLLAQDGIHCTEYVVDHFEDLRWRPDL